MVESIEWSHEVSDWSACYGAQWQEEPGIRFLRLHSSQTGSVVSVTRELLLPAGVEALELTWRQRVTRCVPGDRPFFDARIALAFVDGQGRVMEREPASPYLLDATAGWVNASASFPVHAEAVALNVSPTLYTAHAASFDVADLTVRAVDPVSLRVAAEHEAERIRASCDVADEEPQPDGWPEMLCVVGNRLHDSVGNDVWLQGVNPGGLQTEWDNAHVEHASLAAIEDWNSNCIRLPVSDSFWFGCGKGQEDGGASYRTTVDKIVTRAANRGAYVAIDLHRFRAPKSEHVDFWVDCATRYKNHPAVLFDIFNEPHDISWEIWRNGGFVGESGEHDESSFLSDAEKQANQGFESVGMQGLVDAVRSTGARNIIIAGGLWWCNDLRGVLEGYALDDREGNGIMYSWHTYHWHGQWAERVLPVAKKYPIFLGEVGADIVHFPFVPEEEPQENPYTWVPDMLGFIQKHGIHWTGWCFHPSHSPILISDWNLTPTPFWGRFVRSALAGKPFELQQMR